MSHGWKPVTRHSKCEAMHLRLLKRKEYFRLYNASRKAKSLEWQRENSARRNAAVRLRRALNPELFRAYDRKRAAARRKPPLTEFEIAAKKSESRAKRKAREAKWRRINPEKQKAYCHKWRENNRLRERERGRHFRLIDPESSRAISRKYHELHPEKALARGQRRRAIILGASVGNGDVVANWLALWKSKKRVVCYWCLRAFSPNDCHADHVFPISKGGEHSIDNLVIACANCNQRKHDKSPASWNSEIQMPTLL